MYILATMEELNDDAFDIDGWQQLKTSDEAITYKKKYYSGEEYKDLLVIFIG